MRAEGAVGGELVIGRTVIAYAVRTSGRARAMRVGVTPGGVEVVVPEGTAAGEVEAFLGARRRWVFDAVQAVAARHAGLLAQQYASGAKLQVRGRWLMLDVREEAVEAVGIACRSKLHVTVPRGLAGEARAEAVRGAFEGWLKGRAREDLVRLGRRHAAALGVEAAGYRLSEAKGRWGSCGKDGVVRAHWQLVQAPLCVMEYVVAHEVTHLLHRHHGEAFWQTLGRTLPAWPEHKAALARWEGERRSV
jgi:predicted metal-dependent hydrolase